MGGVDGVTAAGRGRSHGRSHGLGHDLGHGWSRGRGYGRSRRRLRSGAWRRDYDLESSVRDSQLRRHDIDDHGGECCIRGLQSS